MEFIWLALTPVSACAWNRTCRMIFSSKVVPVTLNHVSCWCFYCLADTHWSVTLLRSWQWRVFWFFVFHLANRGGKPATSTGRLSVRVTPIPRLALPLNRWHRWVSHTPPIPNSVGEFCSVGNAVAGCLLFPQTNELVDICKCFGNVSFPKVQAGVCVWVPAAAVWYSFFFFFFPIGTFFSTKLATLMWPDLFFFTSWKLSLGLKSNL